MSTESKLRYCVDCNKQLNINACYNNNLRCKACSNKFQPRGLKDGRTFLDYYCRECEAPISTVTALYGGGLCLSCCHKGERGSNYLDGRTTKAYFCRDCGKPISVTCIYNDNGYRCGSCAKKEQWKDPTNHPNWKGGISFEIYPKEFSQELKNFIRDRDNRQCCICGISESTLYRQLDIHHIDYNKHNCDVNNLVSLCFACHIKTNYNRESWSFQLKTLLNFLEYGDTQNGLKNKTENPQPCK